MRVQSDTLPKKMEILGDKVLVRSDINLVARTDDFGATEMYEYDEVRYKKDKYIEMLKTENNQVWDTLTFLLDMTTR